MIGKVTVETRSKPTITFRVQYRGKDRPLPDGTILPPVDWDILATISLEGETYIRFDNMMNGISFSNLDDFIKALQELQAAWKAERYPS